MDIKELKDNTTRIFAEIDKHPDKPELILDLLAALSRMTMATADQMAVNIILKNLTTPVAKETNNPH